MARRGARSYTALVSKPLPSREAVVESLRELRRPAHAAEIRSRLGVDRAQNARFTELLEQLTVEGTLALDGNRFALKRRSGVQDESWEGTFSGNARGFGFVAAAGKDDVYVAQENVGAALHGDTVRIAVLNRSRRGVEGRVIEIVTRRSPRVAGIVRKKRRAAWLEPDDLRLRGPIVLLAGLEQAQDGDAAVAEITRFPDFSEENPEGIVIALLGAPGSAQVEVAKILIRERVEEEHPAEAIREAEAMAVKLARLTADGGRKDLREIPFLTIDPADARDHDDSVYVERTDTGFRAYVAIADVSEYVQAGTALDAEALRRGCTIYLPDRAVPMLPAALAANLCSLLPEKERYCLCAIVDLDKQGKVLRAKVVEGLMRAAALITYGSAARALGFTEEPARSPQAEAFKRELKVIDDLTRKLRRRRMERGALDLDLPEAQVVLDEESRKPVDVKRRAQDPGVRQAYRLVEELMLLANEVVAQWMIKRKSLAIFRVHAKPDEQKLERLGHAAQLLGVRFELAEMQEAKGLGRFLSSLEGHPRKNVLEMLTLRSLKQAVYDIANIGHFGLASDAYLHFTSPIRRYPDLVVHRTVKALLRGAPADTSASAVEQMRSSATRASDRERSAMQVEREVVDLYRALLMVDRVGEQYRGTVTAFVGSGMYVALDAPYVDVLVRFESMGEDHYELSEDELSVFGAQSGELIELGQTVSVEIEDVALLRRTVYARRLGAPSADSVGPRREGRGRKLAPSAARGAAPAADGGSAPRRGSGTGGPGAQRGSGPGAQRGSGSGGYRKSTKGLMIPASGSSARGSSARGKAAGKGAGKGEDRGARGGAGQNAGRRKGAKKRRR